MTALEQNASVGLVTELEVPDLPPEVEIQPLSKLTEITHWADFLAVDTLPESLSALRQNLGLSQQAKVPIEAQAVFESHLRRSRRTAPRRVPGPNGVLVITSMPCGGMADCGVCAVTTHRGWKMACKHGPVFDLFDLI